MFFSEQDAERLAYYAWVWDTDRSLTARSWETVKDQYRARAAFIVDALNADAEVAA